MQKIILCTLLSTGLVACGSTSKSSSITAGDLQAVQGNGIYLQVMLAGSAVVQVDANDNATCKAFGADVVKKNPSMATNTRCTDTSFKSQLPYTAVMREVETNIEISSHFRSEALCKKFITGTDTKTVAIVRNCIRS